MDLNRTNRLSRIKNLKNFMKVIREGQEVEIHKTELVVGDVIRIKEGDSLVADGLLIQGDLVEVLETSMTGSLKKMQKLTFRSCREVRKYINEKGFINDILTEDLPSPVLVSGTSVVRGTGRMLVTAVGVNSQLGKIRPVLADEFMVTPLQLHLEGIASKVGLFAVFGSIMIIVFTLLKILLMRYWYRTDYSLKDHGITTAGDFFEIISKIQLALALFVTCTPEGLPLAVTIGISSAIPRLLRDSLLVRSVRGLETLAEVSVVVTPKSRAICLDKYTVTHLFNTDLETLYDYENMKAIPFESVVHKSCVNLFKKCFICNLSQDLGSEEEEEDNGNSIDLAFLNYMSSCGVDVEAVSKHYIVLKRNIFSSERRVSSVVIEEDINDPEEDQEASQQVLLIKGAISKILGNCDQMLELKTGEVRVLEDQEKDAIYSAANKLSKRNIRVLALGYKVLEEDLDLFEFNTEEMLSYEKKGLIFLGLIGLRDIIKPESPSTINQLRTAGIRTVLCSGDSLYNVSNTAEQIGLISESIFENRVGSSTKTGKDFREEVGSPVLSGHPSSRRLLFEDLGNFKQTTKDLKVLARSTPEVRRNLVIGLRQSNEVVAVLSSKVRDLDSVKNSSLSIAMGVSSCEIIKSNSDIIAIDDSLATIWRGVLWGRNLHFTLRMYVQFILTANLVLVYTVFASFLMSGTSPFGVAQMLWVSRFWAEEENTI